MMKTLCVAVFVLSLTSVCWPASLDCEQLLKPADKSPDLSGSWYFIAMSLDSNSFKKMKVPLLSGEMTVTPMDPPNIINVNIKLKVYGHCINKSFPFFYENSTLFGVDSNNAPNGEADVLLQTGCTDCIVGKGNGSVMYGIMLLSRRENVADAELKEFEAQTRCHGWPKPQVLNSDHDFENCPRHAIGDTDSDTRIRTCCNSPQGAGQGCNPHDTDTGNDS